MIYALGGMIAGAVIIQFVIKPIERKRYRQECEKLDWVKTIRGEMARTQEKLANAHFDEKD